MTTNQTTMTSRERIIAALEHRHTDRLPIDFSGTDCSSVHLVAYDALRKHLRVEPKPIRLACAIQQLAVGEKEIQDIFRADAQGLFYHPRQWRLWDSGYGFCVEVPFRWQPEDLPDGKTVIRDARGVIRFQRTQGGNYFDPVSHIFADVASLEELDQYQSIFGRWDWPAVLDESVEEYATRAKKEYSSTDRAVVASWRMHYLQAGQIMRGYEQFMIDLLTDEVLVHAMLEKLHQVYMERAEIFLNAMGDSVDIVFFTDDLGTQNGPLISPAVYRKTIKPYWKELIALVKKYGIKVLMHSCGAIAEFIPDLIEIGVDAVNPVQITASGMEPARLKREYSKNIAFWGGGVSTQGTLDRATPKEVREEVKRNIEIFTDNGGYIFTPVHNIQSNVPPENIITAYKTAMEY